MTNRQLVKISALLVTIVIGGQSGGPEESGQQTLWDGGLQGPPALAVSLLQGDVEARGGEGVAALLRLDQVPGGVGGENHSQMEAGDTEARVLRVFNSRDERSCVRYPLYSIRVY